MTQRSSCVEWSGRRTNDGYGYMFRDGRRWLAHRYAWMMANGRPPARGEVVCHSCDNPGCVNPDHLWVGTQKQNVRDMYAKGRNNNSRGYGETVGIAKLTAALAKTARDDPRPSTVIAAELGVGATAIREIKAGRTWVRAIREYEEGMQSHG